MHWHTGPNFRGLPVTADKITVCCLTCANPCTRFGTNLNTWPVSAFIVTSENSPEGSTATELEPFHVPTVPMSVKVPVTASIVYIEMLCES